MTSYQSSTVHSLTCVGLAYSSSFPFTSRSSNFLAWHPKPTSFHLVLLAAATLISLPSLTAHTHHCPNALVCVSTGPGTSPASGLCSEVFCQRPSHPTLCKSATPFSSFLICIYLLCVSSTMTHSKFLIISPTSSGTKKKKKKLTSKALTPQLVQIVNFVSL